MHDLIFISIRSYEKSGSECMGVQMSSFVKFKIPIKILIESLHRNIK